MLVVRRLVALSVLLVPILAPAWGGNRDALRETEPETTTIVTRTAIVRVAGPSIAAAENTGVLPVAFTSNVTPS